MQGCEAHSYFFPRHSNFTSWPASNFTWVRIVVLTLPPPLVSEKRWRGVWKRDRIIIECVASHAVTRPCRTGWIFLSYENRHRFWKCWLLTVERRRDGRRGWGWRITHRWLARTRTQDSGLSSQDFPRSAIEFSIHRPPESERKGHHCCQFID